MKTNKQIETMLSEIESVKDVTLARTYQKRYEIIGNALGRIEFWFWRSYTIDGESFVGLFVTAGLVFTSWSKNMLVEILISMVFAAYFGICLAARDDRRRKGEYVVKRLVRRNERIIYGGLVILFIIQIFFDLNF